ncbi:MAG: hypothetical protein IT324_19500 [Anaerolineae bacterium]|nr:hypothetical protein [Anaerolineae bacterium]
MNQIMITGYSDDVIEVEGDIREEFACYIEKDQQFFVAVSDGHLFRVRYDEDGLWRFDRLIAGSAEYLKTEGDVQQDTNDKVILTGTIQWVVLATDKAVKK